MAISNKISLFIDESGKPDLDDPNYRHFLLTGVVLPESELEIVSGYFSYIKRKYGLPSEQPFHTYDLLENPKTRLTSSSAKNFVMSMEEFIATCPISIFLIHTDKTKFIKHYKRRLDSMNESSWPNFRKNAIYFLSAYGQFEMFIETLKKQNHSGSIYADSRYNQDRDLLDAFLIIRDPLLKGGKINPLSEASRKFLTTLTFANKFSLTAGLELADFISFTAFAKIQRKMAQFNEIKLNNGWRSIENKLVSKRLFEVRKELVERFIPLKNGVRKKNK